MKTLEELMKMTDKDLKVDDTEIDRESLSTPYLYDKYLKFYIYHKKNLKKVMREYDSLYKDRWEYYTGKHDIEVYDKVILKGDLHIYMKADQMVQTVSEEVNESENIVEFLEKTLKNIENRGWALKNLIEWRKFLSGVG